MSSTTQEFTNDTSSKQSNAPKKAPDLLKVSSKSSPASVAGAIAGMIKDGAHVEIQSVGAGAVNQAVKAIAISRGFLSPVGIEVVCFPYFSDIVINGETRTAIRFRVEPKTPAGKDAQSLAPQDTLQTTPNNNC